MVDKGTSTVENRVVMDEEPASEHIKKKQEYLNNGFKCILSKSDGSKHIYEFVREEPKESQCEGNTSDGDRCQNMTDNDNGYCWQHQEQAGE